MTTITQADRDMVGRFIDEHGRHLGPAFGTALLLHVSRYREAAFEAGAKAMQGRALNAIAPYFCGCGASIFDDGCCEVDEQPADDLNYYSAPDAIAALDPAQIAGGEK